MELGCGRYGTKALRAGHGYARSKSSRKHIIVVNGFIFVPDTGYCSFAHDLDRSNRPMVCAGTVAWKHCSSFLRRMLC